MKQSRIISENNQYNQTLRTSYIGYKVSLPKIVKEKKQILLKYLLRVIFQVCEGVNVYALPKVILLMKQFRARVRLMSQGTLCYFQTTCSCIDWGSVSRTAGLQLWATSKVKFEFVFQLKSSCESRLINSKRVERGRGKRKRSKTKPVNLEGRGCGVP